MEHTATNNHLPDDDDKPIGRILNRREVLSLLGIAGAGLFATACTPAQTAATATAAATAAEATAAEATPTLSLEGALAADPTVQAAAAAENAEAIAANAQIAVPDCVVRPEVTEGPYYVDLDLVRTDIREDREGAPLQLTFNVAQVSEASCTPYAGVVVEIWHCDAAGQYSGVSDPGFDTSDQTWLRGAQVTDANGTATFTTIYPGWYSSRAVHIHFKIHPTEELVFTSQLFFPEEFTDGVFTAEPYAAKGQRDTLNSTDSIYQELLLLSPTQAGDGYAAAFPIGIDLSTVGTGDTGGGGSARP